MLCILPTAAAVELIELHGPDGQIVWLNPAEISTLRMPTSADLKRHFPSGARCIVVMSNGKFVAVTETCAGIRSLLR